LIIAKWGHISIIDYSRQPGRATGGQRSGIDKGFNDNHGSSKTKLSSVGTTSPSPLIGVIGRRDRMDPNLQSKIESITTQLIEH
jgi:hypothetical protein